MANIKLLWHCGEAGWKTRGDYKAISPTASQPAATSQTPGAFHEDGEGRESEGGQRKRGIKGRRRTRKVKKKEKESGMEGGERWRGELHSILLSRVDLWTPEGTWLLKRQSFIGQRWSHLNFSFCHDMWEPKAAVQRHDVFRHQLVERSPQYANLDDKHCGFTEWQSMNNVTMIPAEIHDCSRWGNKYWTLQYFS